MRSPLDRRGRRLVGPSTTADSDPSARTTVTVPGSTRALAPLSGVLLLALTVGVASVAAGAVFAAADVTDGPPPQASLSLAVEGRTLTFTHRGGDTLDVRRLRLVVRVDGDPLAHQPPVPFFAARGYRSGPTGPFNRATDPRWSAGEVATLRVAGTNQPALSTADVVTVQVFVDGTPLSELSARPS